MMWTNKVHGSSSIVKDGKGRIMEFRESTAQITFDFAINGQDSSVNGAFQTSTKFSEVGTKHSSQKIPDRQRRNSKFSEVWRIVNRDYIADLDKNF
jgi:hypothetical protein